MQKQEPKIIAPGYSDEELSDWLAGKARAAKQLYAFQNEKAIHEERLDQLKAEISAFSKEAEIEVLPQEELVHDEFSTPTEEKITIDKALFKQLLHLALNNPNFASQIADIDVNCGAAPASEIFMHLKPSDFLLRLETALRAFG